ncbi:MAG TPA: hypothetical protein VID95_01045 [Candidatus Limnocylindrales bacterium]
MTDHPTAEPQPATPGSTDPTTPSVEPAGKPANEAPANESGLETAAAQVAATDPNGPAEPTPAEPARPSLFQDRQLTPLEQKRLDVARVQPKPWEPTDDLLDPNRDAGWETAADHELIAIRPEDVVSPQSQPFVAPSLATLPAAGAYVPATGAAAAATSAPPPTANPAGPATAALTWASAGAGVGAPAAPAAALGVPPAGTAPFASAAVVPIGAAAGQPAPEVALAPSERRWRRAAHATRGRFAVVARPIMLAGLFLIGIVMGWSVFLRGQTAVAQQPTPQQAVAANEGTTEKVPPQILSLIAALQADDQTAVQLVVPAQPYRLLAGELAVDGISRIVGARALYTYTVDNESATEILVSGVDQSGNGLTLNLVVHLKDGAITDFR